MIQTDMQRLHELNGISDDDLLTRLSDLVGHSRRIEADLVAHIGEVDVRRLYARESTPSMFVFCTQTLHLSESEAYLRIGVARAGRRHPVLMEMLRDGRLHLSAIAKIAPLLDDLDEVGHAELLRRATHKSKREVEELIAELAPRPDVPESIRKVPVRPVSISAAVAVPQLRPDAVGDCAVTTGSREPVEARTSPGRVEPLAPERYKVTFTASAELRDKLDRLRALSPGEDLADLIETAVTERLQRVEARRLGKVQRPRKEVGDSDLTAGSRHVPAAVKRVVVERDGERCTFVNAAGKRCCAREGLEFHHDRPFALGGGRGPENIRLLCRAHNVHLAEQTYGRSVLRRGAEVPGIAG